MKPRASAIRGIQTNCHQARCCDSVRRETTGRLGVTAVSTCTSALDANTATESATRRTAAATRIR